MSLRRILESRRDSPDSPIVAFRLREFQATIELGGSIKNVLAPEGIEEPGEGGCRIIAAADRSICPDRNQPDGFRRSAQEIFKPPKGIEGFSNWLLTS